MLSSRDPRAEAQIAEARGPEETPLEVDVTEEFARRRFAEGVSSDKANGVFAIDGDRSVQGVPDVTLTGDEAANYLALRAAAKRALVAQNAHASAGAELREAIQALCKAMAPG